MAQYDSIVGVVGGEGVDWLCPLRRSSPVPPSFRYSVAIPGSSTVYSAPLIHRNPTCNLQRHPSLSTVPYPPENSAPPLPVQHTQYFSPPPASESPNPPPTPSQSPLAPRNSLHQSPHHPRINTMYQIIWLLWFNK